MKTFNSIEEMKPYYNEKTYTYEFIEEGNRLDIKLAFDLNVNANITAGDIDAEGIDALNIIAGDISALSINANKILYYAVCFAYQNIVCEEIKGIRKNAKHFVLDGTITIIGESK